MNVTGESYSSNVTGESSSNMMADSEDDDYSNAKTEVVIHLTGDTTVIPIRLHYCSYFSQLLVYIKP